MNQYHLSSFFFSFSHLFSLWEKGSIDDDYDYDYDYYYGDGDDDDDDKSYNIEGWRMRMKRLMVNGDENS